MRKRSKYRPKGVFENPIAYVLGGFKPVTAHKDELMVTKVRVHGALASLVKGTGNMEDVNILIRAGNTCEALYRMGIGSEYNDELRIGLDALYAVGNRGYHTGKFTMWADEITALSTMMELHDAQMEVITVADLQKAIAIVNKEAKHRKMRSLRDPQPTKEKQ